MNLIAIILSLSTFMMVLTQAVTFHKATVCRQRAWLKSTELLTRKTLSAPPEKDQLWDFNCKLIVRRDQEKISWQRLTEIHSHDFDLVLGSGL